MSASSMEAFTCMWVRSFAITNRVGAWREAATVCPTSTLRATTTPSMGARMMLWPRSTWACWRAAAACATSASLAWRAATAPS